MMECSRVRGAFRKSQRSAQREVPMHRHTPWLGALSIAAVLSRPAGASGHLPVAHNVGKAVLTDGMNSVQTGPPRDTVALIDLNAKPPTVVAEIEVPASVIGPPLSVAVARDESFAL